MHSDYQFAVAGMREVINAVAREQINNNNDSNDNKSSTNNNNNTDTKFTAAVTDRVYFDPCHRSAAFCSQAMCSIRGCLRKCNALLVRLICKLERSLEYFRVRILARLELWLEDD